MSVGDVRQFFIAGPAGRLEASARDADSPVGAVVLAHPHPLYGGTLDNPVMFHSDRELNRIGFATLRFNFRGVGSSEGEHDDGHGEVDDIAAAVGWMRDAFPDVPLLIVGYSFGSLCAFRYATGDGVATALVGIGVPVRIYSFQLAEKLRAPLAVVQGSMDEFGSPEEIGMLLRGSTVRHRLWVVDGGDHRFTQQAPDAAKSVAAAARWCLEGD